LHESGERKCLGALQGTDADFSGDWKDGQPENGVVVDTSLKDRLQELLESIRALTEETKQIVRDSEKLISERQKTIDRYQARRAPEPPPSRKSN